MPLRLGKRLAFVNNKRHCNAEVSVTSGNGTTRDIVARLWDLCNILRGNGITYTDYVTELTFLLLTWFVAALQCAVGQPSPPPRCARHPLSL